MSPISVKDIYRVDRSAVERQLGHPIKTLSAHGPRYCFACDEYTKARECKACGMPTEKVPTK